MKKWGKSLLIWMVILASIVLMIALAQQAPDWAMLQIIEFAQANGVDYHQYPDCLVELLTVNPEAKEFVLNYPFRGDKPVEVLEYDLSNGVPLFIQWDSQWGYLEYGSELGGTAGSGPMCLAMAGYYLSGGDRQFYPDRILEYADQNGYYSDKKGTNSALLTEGGPALGLKVISLPKVRNKIAAYLHNGDPIVAFLPDSDLAQSGRYVLVQWHSEGKLTVNDPTSRITSKEKWTYEEFIAQARNLWVIQKAE